MRDLFREGLLVELCGRGCGYLGGIGIGIGVRIGEESNRVHVDDIQEALTK